MKYVYDDIVNLRLPEKYLVEFLEALDDNFNPTAVSILSEDLEEEYYISMYNILGSICAKFRTYNERKIEQNRILSLWLKIVKKMSKVEKVLEGWDKL